MMRTWLFIPVVAVLCAAQDSAPRPYHDAREAPLAYNGPGRDDPDPIGLTEVRIAYFGPPDAADLSAGQIWAGAAMAIEEANRQGGYRTLPFRLVPFWDANPWKGGVAALARAAFDGRVWAILGGIDGATTHLAEQVVAKAQLTIVNPIATDRSIHTARVPWVFSCVPGDQTIAALLSAELKRRDVGFGLISAIDHDSRALVSDLQLAFTRDRLGPALHLEWDTTAENAARLSREAASARLGAWVVVAPAAESGAFIRAVRAAGFTGPILAGPSAARTSAGALPGEVLYPVLGEIPSGFAAKFRARWQRDPDYTAAYAYDAANILIAAIRKGGLNRPRIREAVRALAPIQGVTGIIEWDPQGQNRAIGHALARP